MSHRHTQGTEEEGGCEEFRVKEGLGVWVREVFASLLGSKSRSIGQGCDLRASQKRKARGSAIGRDENDLLVAHLGTAKNSPEQNVREIQLTIFIAIHQSTGFLSSLRQAGAAATTVA